MDSVDAASQSTATTWLEYRIFWRCRINSLLDDEQSSVFVHLTRFYNFGVYHMAKRSLADLSAAFEQKTGGGGGNQDWKKFFGFWRAPIDSISVVRFLPDLDEDNPMGFLVENFTHELVVNGKREKVACLKMYGEECPICALSQKYYDEKSAEHNEELGKKYYRKKGYIGQVLVLDTPVEHDAEQLVKLIEFGPKIFNQIQSAFKSGDLEDPPYELKGGYNFRIKKTQSGQYADYGTSNFSPKRTDVADDVIEAIELFDLKTFRTAKTARAQLEAMLIADQTGAAMVPEAGVQGGHQQAGAAPAVARQAQPARATEDEAPAPAAAATSAPAADGTKKLSVVEQLRLRQQQKAAAAAGNDGE
jgi:hypothetical protein